MPPGVQAAQIAHAAGAGSTRHPPGAYVVVLAVPGEPELRDISHQLRAAGVDHTVVAETDRPWHGRAMAIGTELLRDRSHIRKVVSSLPLLGKEVLEKAA